MFTIFNRESSETAEAATPPNNSHLIPSTEIFLDTPSVAMTLSSVIEETGARMHPGQSEVEIADTCERLIVAAGLSPIMKGYNGYPASVSISRNHQVLHSVPSNLNITEGDLVKIATSVKGKYAFGQQSWTFCVGKANLQATRLRQALRDTAVLVSDTIRPSWHLGDIGHAIQSNIEKSRFSVIREYCGYGMGERKIQDPQILGYGKAGTGSQLRPGMIINLQLIANAGKPGVRLLPDGWTVVTKHHSLSALFSLMFRVHEDRVECVNKILE